MMSHTPLSFSVCFCFGSRASDAHRRKCDIILCSGCHDSTKLVQPLCFRAEMIDSELTSRYFDNQLIVIICQAKRPRNESCFVVTTEILLTVIFWKCWYRRRFQMILQNSSVENHGSILSLKTVK